MRDEQDWGITAIGMSGIILVMLMLTAIAIWIYAIFSLTGLIVFGVVLFAIAAYVFLRITGRKKRRF